MWLGREVIITAWKHSHTVLEIWTCEHERQNGNGPGRVTLTVNVLLVTMVKFHIQEYLVLRDIIICIGIQNEPSQNVISIKRYLVLRDTYATIRTTSEYTKYQEHNIKRHICTGVKNKLLKKQTHTKHSQYQV